MVGWRARWTLGMVAHPLLISIFNLMDDMRRGVCPRQQGGDHNTGVRELPTCLLHHLLHCLSSVPTEPVQVICSCVDHQALRALEGLLFQQLHCLACLDSTFFPGQSLFVSRNFPFETACRTTCGGTLGWAELAVGSRLCGCIRGCQDVVGLNAGQRVWDGDKAEVWDTDRESLCSFTSAN